MPSFKRISSGIQVIFDIPSEDGSRKQKKLSGYKTRQEANLAYIAFMANYKPLEATNSSIEDDFNSYLDYLKDTVKESSYVTIKSDYDNHIIPYFNNHNEITPQDILKWHKYLKENNKLAQSTIKKISQFLNNYYTYLRTFRNYRGPNPLTNIKLKEDESVDKEMLFWTEEEFLKFISKVDDLVYKTFFSLLYLTGCRRGEALALNWHDISGFNLNIIKTLGYHTEKGGFKITKTKNKYSKRIIIIPAVLKRMLDSLKEYYKTFEDFSLDNFIFGNSRTLPPQTIRNNFDKYTELAKVKRIRIHDFRHSHASYLISKGYDIVTVSRRLGHANIEMTLNTYSHLMPNRQIELMAALNLDIQ